MRLRVRDCRSAFALVDLLRGPVLYRFRWVLYHRRHVRAQDF